MNEQTKINSAEMVPRDRVAQGKQVIWSQCLARAFFNRITAVPFCLVIVSSITDIIMAEPGKADPAMIILFSTMLIVSIIMRFTQEFIEGLDKSEVKQ